MIAVTPQIRKIAILAALVCCWTWGDCEGSVSVFGTAGRLAVTCGGLAVTAGQPQVTRI